MNRIAWLSLVLGLSFTSRAQDTLSEKSLGEVIIYSNKFAEHRKNIVQKIEVISAQRIAQLNSQNTGDLLINSGNVFVQKSQQGGSSPVVRGFEASRVLLVVDGIRMNNAIYRAGHLQNVITVDQNMLERVEVLYGPASTLYGSDALGGVVHMRTKMPRLSDSGKLLWTGSAFTRYSSANHEKTGHLDLSVGSGKLAWLQSYNYSDFDDLRMGDEYPDDYPDFGRRTQYIETRDGADYVVTNPDDRNQRFSGYSQWDITQKLLYKPSARVAHTLNLQFSNSSDIPRYDRLQDQRNGALRWAEWYYGPQQRTLAAYEFSADSVGFFTNLRSIVSYQHIEESRHQREYQRYDRLDNRYEELDVLAAVIDVRKLWSAHELTVGADMQLNDLSSSANRVNIQTGAISPLDSRYPNGENRMKYYGTYAQHTFKFGGRKWVLNDGIRLQVISLRSTIADNSFFRFPFTEIEQANAALTGNIGLVYMPTDATRLTLGAASGFRAPNIDDASRVFESGSNQLIVPNPDIKPEYTSNVDLGISQAFGERVRLEATGFYTWFRNAIALAPYQLDGKDSAFYNGGNVRVFANQNVNRAILYGYNAAATVDFTRALRLYSTINYTYGQQRQKSGKVPLDHIPPVFGKTSVSYTGSRISAEAYALYNGWKRLKDYNPNGEDNLQYATPEGMPSWMTLNLKASVDLHRHLTLQAGVENILDRNYRYFASGFSAPGRNINITLRSTF
ncbi:MAG TPA: TonB-dependent receptor [Chitinophagaceae bacterium]